MAHRHSGWWSSLLNWVFEYFLVNYSLHVNNMYFLMLIPKKSWDQTLCDVIPVLFFKYVYTYILEEEGMAIHSSILAWRIPWTEEPGGLQSMGLQRVGHDWSNLAHTHAHTHIICVCVYMGGTATTIQAFWLPDERFTSKINSNYVVGQLRFVILENKNISSSHRKIPT